MLTKSVSMIRHLLIGFLIVISASAVDAYAVNNLQTVDDNRKSVCQTLPGRLEIAYNAEKWETAALIAEQMLQCERAHSLDAYTAHGDIVLWRIRALYRAEQYSELLQEIQRLRDERSTSAIPGLKMGQVLYYGYLSANRLGEDDRALSYVEAAQAYALHLTAKTRAQVASSRMHAASTAGQYKLGLAAAEDAQQLLSNASVSDEWRARLHRAEAMLRLYHTMDRQDEGALGFGYDRIRELLRRAESLYTPNDDASIAYLRAAHSVVFALEGSYNVAEASAQQAIDRARQSQTDWSVGYANLLAARVSVLASDGETALARLDRAETILARRGNSARAEIEELRVRAHAVNARYDQALASMWKLRNMEAPGARHRMQMASVATVGGGGFLPWGIATALLCLASGIVATYLPRWLRAALLPSGFTTPWPTPPAQTEDDIDPEPFDASSTSAENVLQS